MHVAKPKLGSLRKAHRPPTWEEYEITQNQRMVRVVKGPPEVI